MSDFAAFESLIKQELSGLVQVVIYECIGSTNAEAKKYAADTAERRPVLFLAREQTAGRGRLGRHFVSRCDGGIYMTLLYFTRDALCDAVTVTTAAAVAAALSIERATGQSVGIKWVNDIYVEKGKVAGILVETVPVRDGYAIAVGIGINEGDVDFPPEIRDIAASLGDIDTQSKVQMVKDICEHLLLHAKHHSDRAYMSDYHRMFILKDKTVDLFISGQHVLRGTVMGVDDEGALMILPLGEREIRAFSSGEITVRPVEQNK